MLFCIRLPNFVQIGAHCRNMTSYPFLKMAAATAKYYFRLRICWCYCLQKVTFYQQTKLCRDISIGGWDITTSVFEIQTSAILEFYFRFQSRPFRRNRRVILHPAAEISSKSEHPPLKYNVISIFKMAGVSHVVFDLGQWRTTHKVPFMVWIPTSNR